MRITIREAIERADELKPNTFDNAQKKHWLSEVEMLIKHEIYDTHRHTKNEFDEFEGFDENTGTDTELFAPVPYDSLYIYYLHMQIDRLNHDSNSYQTSASAFSAAYQSYAAWYNRTYAPLDRCQRFKFLRR